MSHEQYEDETAVVLAANQERQGLSQWLWSKPLGQHVAEEDDEDEIETLVEDLWDEDREARCKHLYSARTRSWATAPELSSSGRIYQRVQHSALDYSQPSISIKSSWSRLSSSQRPLPPTEVPSLTKSTQHASWLPWSLHSGSSASLQVGSPSLGRGKLMGKNGSPRKKSSSTSPTKAMVLR